MIVWGAASVSMQHITGESQPVRMAAGGNAVVPAGSLNSDGLLVVRVTATADESTPARMARMAEAAQVCCHARAVICDMESDLGYFMSYLSEQQKGTFEHHQ